MTKQELDNYEKLQDIFQMRCEMICHILNPLDDAFNYVYEFEINGDLVECEGVEYWSYGGEEKHYAEFPKEYIYMDDKEIQKIVDAELKKRSDERTIYKYQSIHHDFVPKWVRTTEDLLTYEDDIRKVNPYYTCYDGQLIYVRDEEKVYMLKDYTNSRSMSSWKAIGEHKKVKERQILEKEQELEYYKEQLETAEKALEYLKNSNA